MDLRLEIGFLCVIWEIRIRSAQAGLLNFEFYEGVLRDVWLIDRPNERCMQILVTASLKVVKIKKYMHITYYIIILALNDFLYFFPINFRALGGFIA